MNRLFISVFLFLWLAFSGFSQNKYQDNSTERLRIFSSELSNEYDKRRSEALEYAGRKQIPVKCRLIDGRSLELQYLDKLSFPVYHITFNREAAATVKTDKLHPSGESGLDLSGMGHSVGIWDAGIVDSFHHEFEGRLYQKNTYERPDNHATHVAGTIAAEGINQDAKGMAFQADILSYNWNNYLSEVASEALDGLLISNKSFGISLGWTWDGDDWVWNGDPDANEDYRFGFYSEEQSLPLDQIAWYAPNILMVWAAGNYRIGEGDGTREPNGPYNCIGPEASAKNILAVGAVEKISEGYSEPSDVVMTSFSSWGPTDDGRVKPDIVAPGLNLFSTTSYGNYQTMSGTSMAAPVAAGSLLLLQELFHSKYGFHMRSATLKALAIHTVNETGMNKGPDYSYGWGLLNTSAAADVIKDNDSVSVFIRELSLSENEVYEFDIYSDGLSELTATITWTDPPGTPAPSGTINPTDLMLVNDLDIRIIDEAGTMYYPWILDPDNPGMPAVRGDNFRDNTEKILIENTEPRKYTVSISHKNELEGGSQDYSLILTASVSDPAGETTLYWIGEGGGWHNPLNWSFSSGGNPAGLVPDEGINVVVDENSFSDSLQTITLDSNAYCRSFSWLAWETNGIDFGSYNILLHRDFLVSRGISGSGTNGSFVFSGETGIINAGANKGDPYNFVFDNEEGTWEFLTDAETGRIILVAGSIYFNDKRTYVNSFSIEGEKPKYIRMAGSELFVKDSFDLTGDNLIFDAEGMKVIINRPEREYEVIFRGDNHRFTEIDVVKGKLLLSGNMVIEKLINQSLLEIYGNNHFSELLLEQGSETFLEGGSEQIIAWLSINSTPESMVILNSLSDQPAKIIIDDYIKLCFDYLRIGNVIAEGEAVVVAGKNSLFAGKTTGWIEGICEDVLFARFYVEYPCAHSITSFIDQSDGDIDTWSWDFGNENDPESTSTLQNPSYTYTIPGIYDVSLSISGEAGGTGVKNAITVIENTIPENEIIISTLLNRYSSEHTAPTYQWYNDGVPIPGATGRSLPMGDYTGEIRVLLSDAYCNRFSERLLVSVYETDEPGKDLIVYPNPVEEKLYIEFTNSLTGPVIFEFIDTAGKVIRSFSHIKSDITLNTELTTGTLSPGLYILRITAGNNVIAVRSFLRK